MLVFKKMNQRDFDSYLRDAVIKVAGEYALSGYYTEEEAMQVSQEAFHRYLPEGLDTVDNYIFNITNDNKEIIGMIWFGKIKNDEVFIYDFIINESHQRKGYGKQTMELLEEYIKKLGCNKISLHVFGHNKAALALYEKMGYEAFSINMSKSI